MAESQTAEIKWKGKVIHEKKVSQTISLLFIVSTFQRRETVGNI